jgi:hypothetical protein
MNKIPVFLTSLVVTVFLVSGMSAHTARVTHAADGGVNKQSVKKIDAQRLAGRWTRPDGGYVMELRDIKKDGSLKASYFNPRPIKVYRAEYRRQEGKLTLFVELRDVNYPGSKYHLRYDPESDRLKGTYFQALERQTFEVEFIRNKDS